MPLQEDAWPELHSWKLSGEVLVFVELGLRLPRALPACWPPSVALFPARCHSQAWVQSPWPPASHHPRVTHCCHWERVRALCPLAGSPRLQARRMGRGASDSHWLIGSPQILCLLLYLALLLLPQIWRKLMLMALFQFAGVTNEVQSTTDSGLKNKDSFFFSRSWRLKSQIKVLPAWFLLRPLSLACGWPLSPHVFTWLSLCLRANLLL